jgi:hypothetical protein
MSLKALFVRFLTGHQPAPWPPAPSSENTQLDSDTDVDDDLTVTSPAFTSNPFDETLRMEDQEIIDEIET